MRNEAEELPALFEALERLEPVESCAVTVCLLLDACADDSLALAEAYRARSLHTVVLAEAVSFPANAGRARHNAMMMGHAILPSDGLLLTTDADTLPAKTWLRAMVAALSHADVVAGRIARRIARPSILQDRVELYYDALFALRRRLDPVPWEADITHHFGGGANLGIRRHIYEALGGFAPVASGEDARLLDEACRAGWRVRRDAASVVHTSDRRNGRALGGLATALKTLDQGDATQIQVTHPIDAAWQYRMQAAARAAHADGTLSSLAAALGLTRDHVRGVMRDCPNAEAFAMRIVPAAPTGMRSVPLTVAEAELTRLTSLREAA